MMSKLEKGELKMHFLSFINKNIPRFIAGFLIIYSFLVSPLSAHAALIIQHPNYTGLNNGLVGYWSFNDPDMSGNTAYDRSGNNNNGTLTGANGLPVRTIGKIGQALSFDGGPTVVNAGSATNLDDLGPITVSAWIFPKSMGGGSLGRIATKANVNAGSWTFIAQGPASNCSVTTANLAIAFNKFNTGGTSYSCRTTVDNSITLNTWQHVVATWDGTSGGSGVHIFVNGVETSYQSTTGSGSIGSDNTYDFLIGNRVDGIRGFDGSIDDVRIYSRALSADEIKRLYNLGR